MVPLKGHNYNCDSYGHVNNVQYLILLEEARTQFMELTPAQIDALNQFIHIITEKKPE